MENTLNSQSQHHYRNLLALRLTDVNLNFQNRAVDFEGFCSSLVNNSALELNSMFTRTYGVIYQQNAHVFSELFHDLQLYLRGAEIDLSDVLDAFFSSLLLRMLL
jgi:hypothetical protein